MLTPPPLFTSRQEVAFGVRRWSRLAAATFFLLMALWTLVTPTGRAQAAERVALVLAAENYRELGSSGVPSEKGEQIAQSLRDRGFDVVTVVNPANAGARVALRDFAGKVAGAEMALAILIGHGLSSADQTFFLPTNSSIENASDLLSRALSIGNVAQIVGRAKVGAVCFLMTSPALPKAIDGLDLKPRFDRELAGNVVVAFSSSAKIPSSRVSATAQKATSEVVDLLRDNASADLQQLVSACGSQQLGSIHGTATKVALAQPMQPSMQPPTPQTAPPRPAITEPAPPAAPHPSALEALEQLLDSRQVRRIQSRLTELGHYQGPIDAVVGALTRQAIKDYQKKSGAPDTGYLTPEQLAALTR